MITYKQIEDWWKQKENKNKVVIGISFILVFFVGFGAGTFERGMRRDSYKPPTNYTTNSNKKAAPVAAKEAEIPKQGIVAAASTTAPSACVVKGNIASGGRKIFHVPGGASYKIVKPEQCFNTEAEAVAAGFVKASR